MISSSVNHAPALTLQSVSRRFGGVEAIRDISLDIAYGERRVILGPNGAGKFKPSSGKVILFGEDITHRSTHYRARQGLTRTYQTTHLFNGLSTLDNLYLAVRGVVPRRMSMHRPGRSDLYLSKARQLAAKAGLEAVLERKVN